MFKRFWLDTILCFLFIIIFAFIITQVKAFKIFDVFDPFGDALADMESTDIVFSQIRKEPVADEDLIIINVGNLPRADIAQLVNIINFAKPKVIGMDIFFRNLKTDTLGDMALADAFSRVENLVMASKLLLPNKDIGFDSVSTSHPIFVQNAETAFVNLISGAANQEDLKVCRTFAPREIIRNEYTELAFSVKLAEKMNPEKAKKFLARNNNVEVINFRGNIFEGRRPEVASPIAYFALDWYQVKEMQFDPELITDKAVIFCYLGSEIGDRNTKDDNYFTPLNKKYAGKAQADMFGGVVHANAFSMIMEEDYIDEMGEVFSYLLAILLLYLNIVVFTVIYKKMPQWYDGLSKIIQLIEAFALFTLLLIVFNVYNYKMDLTVSIIAVLIVGDTLEVFHGVVKNVFAKKRMKKYLNRTKII